MKGDILACWGNTWLDNVISNTTGSKISHIAIMRNDTEIIESLGRGLQISKLSSKQDNYIVLRYRDINYEKACKVIAYLEAHLGTKFDFLQLLDIWFYRKFRVKLNLSSPYSWICIESIWVAFMGALDVDILPNVTDKRYMEPVHIVNSKEIIIVEGDLNK